MKVEMRKDIRDFNNRYILRKMNVRKSTAECKDLEIESLKTLMSL